MLFILELYINDNLTVQILSKQVTLEPNAYTAIDETVTEGIPYAIIGVQTNGANLAITQAYCSTIHKKVSVIFNNISSYQYSSTVYIYYLVKNTSE